MQQYPQGPLVAFSPELRHKLAAYGLYLNHGAQIERNLKFNAPVALFSNAWATRLTVDSYSYISYYSHLTRGSIGRYCSIAHYVDCGLTRHDISCATTSLAVTHSNVFAPFSGWVPRLSQVEQESGEVANNFKIGHDVWIGAHVVIVGDVTIGDGAIIGANSVITHDVPPYAIVAGAGGGANSKGIIKRYRFTDEQISDLLELQ